jgi:hypothetical protein
MNAITDYQKWLETLGRESLLREQENLKKIKVILIDYEGRGATGEDWERIYKMEELAGLRMMNIDECKWYDPIKRAFNCIT